MSEGWEVRPDNYWRMHVVPRNDIREHEPHDKCWCNPTTNDIGVIIHAATDEREKFERGERKPS